MRLRDKKGWNELFPWGWDIVELQVEDFDFNTGDFSFGSGFYNELEFEALAAINLDGKLEVTVKSLASLGFSRRKRSMKEA